MASGMAPSVFTNSLWLGYLTVGSLPDMMSRICTASLTLTGFQLFYDWLDFVTNWLLEWLFFKELVSPIYLH